MEYVFVITRNDVQKRKIDYKNNYKKLYMCFCCFVSVVIIGAFILPINFYNTDTMKYSYGASVNTVFALTGLYMIIMITYIFKNKTNLKKKGYIPIFIFIFLMLIVAVVQKINPGLLLSNFTFALVTVLMYHTIENPDIRMMKELTYSKNLAEESKQRTINALNEISKKLYSSLEKTVVLGHKKINNKDSNAIYEELKKIQKQSVKLTDEISGMIDLAKINSGELEISEEKYDLNVMIEKIKQLMYLERGNKKISLLIDSSDKVNSISILYGDSNLVSQAVIKLFSYLIDIIKIGNVRIIIDNIITARLCRLKFHFIIASNDSINDFIFKEPHIHYLDGQKYLNGQLRLDGSYNNIDYATIQKLMEILNAKIDVKQNIETVDIILSIDQKLMSSFSILSNSPLNKDVKIKYVDLSQKRVLVVDDNKAKIKELLLLLKPYKLNIDIALSIDEMKEYLNSDKTYDLILIDDIIPSVDIETYQQLPKRINMGAEYDIKTVIMINDVDKENQLIECGYCGTIVKPITKANIDDMLKKNLK
ncbi:MAG: response regulator [bacterium]|nr:response regulator [bacterium]